MFQHMATNNDSDPGSNFTFDEIEKMCQDVAHIIDGSRIADHDKAKHAITTLSQVTHFTSMQIYPDGSHKMYEFSEIVASKVIITVKNNKCDMGTAIINMVQTGGSASSRNAGVLVPKYRVNDEYFAHLAHLVGDPTTPAANGPEAPATSTGIMGIDDESNDLAQILENFLAPPISPPPSPPPIPPPSPPPPPEPALRTKSKPPLRQVVGDESEDDDVPRVAHPEEQIYDDDDGDDDDYDDNNFSDYVNLLGQKAITVEDMNKIQLISGTTYAKNCYIYINYAKKKKASNPVHKCSVLNDAAGVMFFRGIDELQLRCTRFTCHEIYIVPKNSPLRHEAVLHTC